MTNEHNNVTIDIRNGTKIVTVKATANNAAIVEEGYVLGHRCSEAD
jgi:hypothetical protein